MKLLSIDVGIKNLAFCYLNITDKEKFEIIKWDVVDLCNSDKNICSGIQKNKKPCTNAATFTKNNVYYCKKHAKNVNFKIPPTELSIKKIKKYKVSKLKELCTDYDISYNYIKGLPYKKQLTDKLLVDLSNNYLDKIYSTNANNFNLVNLGCNLKEAFNTIFKYDEIDTVIVENQIGPLALRMKSLQGMIMQHFIENKITNIFEISSSNKLRDFLNGKKTTYAERKKIGIVKTRELISNNINLKKWITHFNTHKKKDDLADCYLQGLWYIKHKI